MASIYIMINAAMPGIVKIGYTTKDTGSRAQELSSATGVPCRFIVAYEACLEEYYREAESAIHEELKQFRTNSNREFFSLPLADAIAAVTNIVSIYKKQEDRIAGQVAVVELAEMDYIRKMEIINNNAMRERAGQVSETQKEIWMNYGCGPNGYQ